MQRGEWIEDGAATDCGDGREAANDEAVAGQSENGFAEAQLREGGLAGGEFFAFDQRDFGDGFRGGVMKMDARAILKRRGGRQ